MVEMGERRQWLNIRPCLMRYMSVECTVVVPRRLRRRLALLVWDKCRRPALERMIFPLAVILNRLAAAFLVLMPFGRRINCSVVFQKEHAIYVAEPTESSPILGCFAIRAFAPPESAWSRCRLTRRRSRL